MENTGGRPLLNELANEKISCAARRKRRKAQSATASNLSFSPQYLDLKISFGVTCLNEYD